MIGVVNTECMRREGKRQQKCMKALGVYDTVGRFVAAVCAKDGSCEKENAAMLRTMRCATLTSRFE